MSDIIETLTLVTTDGDLIEVEIPQDILEDVLEDFREERSKSGYWHVGNWTATKANFKGVRLSEINMAKIIGLF